MTINIKNNSEEKVSSISEDLKDPTMTADDAVEQALNNVSDRLDEGKTDATTQKMVGDFLTVLIAANPDKAPVPTSLIPGVPTPTSLIPGPSNPATPTAFIGTIGHLHKKDIQDKLFSWIRTYTLNAIFAMPGSMLQNSESIQNYMTQGLNKLSEEVMKDSQAWSKWGMDNMNLLEKVIATIDPSDTKDLNNCTSLFNMLNTGYQKNLELFSSANDGINQTTTTTTQTQTLNNQNITQGPLAMLTMLMQCWSVAA